ncbi:ribosomal RNA small subunit methyltransferase H [Spirochaetia bacterium]|nr:ribosomal RNA small subunit methyltransferase H [Spirochaetia bacterium]
MDIIHTPVLPEETLALLSPRRGDQWLVDATLGEGGHSEAFLSRFQALRITGVDADPEIMATAKERLGDFGDRIEFYSGWSHDFFAECAQKGRQPDLILMDLGVSLFHYEKGGRGFSFRKDETLDMRVDVSRGQGAAELLAKIGEKELADLLYFNADERYSRRIARAIVEARSRSALTSSAVLAEIVERAVPGVYRHGAVHPATRTFQALRIEVNGELSRLEALLEAALGCLQPGGRMGVISFHSAEDRIVKNFFRERSRDFPSSPDSPIGKGGGRLVDILVRKGIVPTEDEIRRNPASRSARLRGVEKVLEKEGL